MKSSPVACRTPKFRFCPGVRRSVARTRRAFLLFLMHCAMNLSVLESSEQSAITISAISSGRVWRPRLSNVWPIVLRELYDGIIIEILGLELPSDLLDIGDLNP